ncbi:unnamed protein product [Vitrella brassicaformis CCMP3155]|uniref:YEATS domain-containing protein n=2 Tax=Vitrella brassicaformis TaxID=1169539 RepID=A0A0G4FBJ4_VITBC|nr:unnamed protein product [Vitrella brassicaformis CCMP3155]|mmetsp:Transcript_5686/g.13554  ORF Transcript_5686/g.13554 Transcript_5686/m.13554 type:complete len:265 (+) Transcript_5686:117-911(+)|eukprot:CEM10002.1 unnamed protein product [Vitrella brassicaformis CCMP3155]
MRPEARRKRGVDVVRPIVIGTYAVMMTKKETDKRQDNATHQWTCLLRSPTNEDLSYFIKKVVFLLHSSFDRPERVVERPPYQVAEYGWGEFEIAVRIHFVDPTEKPLEITHFLRLFKDGSTDVQPPRDPMEAETVAHETYDEVIFHEPSDWFYDKLMAGPTGPPTQHALQGNFEHFDEEAELRKIGAADALIQGKIMELRQQLVEMEKKCKEAHDKRTELMQKQQAAAAIASGGALGGHSQQQGMPMAPPALPGQDVYMQPYTQ